MKLPTLLPVLVFAVTRAAVGIHAFMAREISFALPRSLHLRIPSIRDRDRDRDPSPRIILKAGATDATDEESSASPSASASASASEIEVCDILRELHDSGLPFRIIVIGNGAILESTSVLGPTMGVSESKKTGKPIATFASEDRSFEFHVKPDEIRALALTEKQSPVHPEKTMRSLRFTNEKGPVCILIVGENDDSSSSAEAAAASAASWFQMMVTKYGSEIEF